MIDQIIKTRRSVFPAQYTGEIIPREDILKILDSARWAPNHRKTEPWRYQILTGKALERLGNFMATSYAQTEGYKKFKLKKLQENPTKASAVILIFMHRDINESVPEWEEIAAVSMSVQNMWLTSHDMKYGAYWSSPKPFANIKNLEGIHVADNEQFLGFFYLGTYPYEEQELPERKSIKEMASFINE
ncbi:nitroreductase family protein [Nonlabens ulvanivorans]|uniref:Nitroreductase n=1 Tax=Nonlabens ulvanivorans TaxID=906888 RepID=A0A084JX52_NONUL|nr:nitroreductase [Nonlabens ulvanivorans]KEZ93536.1 nitroreductase [Nonlabens ulvanivorans]PRX14112.1 nitroreductase [Nonlabens ulvanivorans]GAL76063.1 nitroreductase [Nonlabens ulvanivorans]